MNLTFFNKRNNNLYNNNAHCDKLQVIDTELENHYTNNYFI